MLNKPPDGVKSSDLLTVYKASMMVIGICLSVQAPLLFFFLDDSNFRKSANIVKEILLALALCGLFVSLCAAGSGLILINELGKTPAQTQLSHGEAPDSSRGYEGRAWVTWHWLFSLVAGIIFPIAQVFLYIWLEESNTVRITLSIITVFALLPSMYLIPLLGGNGKRDSLVSA